MPGTNISPPSGAAVIPFGSSLPVLHSIEAEAALIGSLLVDNRVLEQVADFLDPAHFYMPVYGRIYESIVRLTDRGQIANPITLKHLFEEGGALAGQGDPGLLAAVAEHAAAPITAGEYARLIHDFFQKRELLGIARDAEAATVRAEAGTPASEIIENTEQRLYDLASTGAGERSALSFHDALDRALEQAEAAHKRRGGLAGVTTGLLDLDALLGGLHKSDLVVIAGRPGMGKTALGTNIAVAAARAHMDKRGIEGAGVGVFSLEMAADQLAARILSEQAELDSDALRRGKLSDEEFDRLTVAAVVLDKLPIFIDDSAAVTISALRTRARRMVRKHNVGLIVVDYIQLMNATTRRNDNRVQEVSEITRGLKILAKELQIPVIALSQLSRQVEQREDKRPQLSDLRESGSIEQDADIVLFIFREEYYARQRKPVEREEEDKMHFQGRQRDWDDIMERISGGAEIIAAKNRHGPTGVAFVHFDGKHTRFANRETAR